MRTIIFRHTNVCVDVNVVCVVKVATGVDVEMNVADWVQLVSTVVAAMLVLTLVAIVLLMDVDVHVVAMIVDVTDVSLGTTNVALVVTVGLNRVTVAEATIVMVVMRVVDVVTKEVKELTTVVTNVVTTCVEAVRRDVLTAVTVLVKEVDVWTTIRVAMVCTNVVVVVDVMRKVEVRVSSRAVSAITVFSYDTNVANVSTLLKVSVLASNCMHSTGKTFFLHTSASVTNVTSNCVSMMTHGNVTSSTVTPLYPPSQYSGAGSVLGKQFCCK